MSFPTPMTMAQIQYAISEMKKEIEIWYSEDHHLHKMIPQMEEMSQHNDYATREKLMRWLGFMQGVMWEHDHYTIDDLRKMNTREL